MTIVNLLLSMVASGQLSVQENQFLEVALRRNLTLRADSLDLRSSGEALVAAQAALGPQLALTGSAELARPAAGGTSTAMGVGGTVSQILPTAAIGSVGWTGSSNRFDPQTPPRAMDSDTSTLSVSLKQPLLRGFGAASPTFQAVAQATSARKLRFLSARGDGLALLQRAKTGFWNLMAIRAQVRALTDDSLRQGRLLEVSRVQFRTGAIAVLDTLTSHQTFGKARLSLLQARQAERDALRQIASIADTTGLSFPQPDTLPEPERMVFPKTAELIESALAHAPAILSAQERLAAQESEVLLRRSNRLPQLDATAFGRTGMPGGNPTSEWTVGGRIDFSWSLPSGAERARYRQALTDLSSLQVKAESSRKELVRQIERILDQYDGSQEQLLVALDLARVQKARLASVEAAVNAGAKSGIDLDAARTDWLSALQTTWSAFAGAKALEAELETNTGIGPARRGWIWEEK
ncbi:MAG: TolC family protein [Fibrobacteres bacterium]|nr:TolC family protein [Fibrobacterota bacterium]